MTVARARFPRRAYARRAERLASDLWDWNSSLRDLALGPDANLVDFRTRETAEARAYVLEELATIADQLADKILALR